LGKAAKMDLKAVVCLLSLSLANAMVPNPSLSSSLSSNIASVLSSSSPSSCLSTLHSMRVSTDTWDKEYDFAKLGLKIKLKYVDAQNPLKGTQMAVDFTVPELLRWFTMGVTELTLDVVLEAPKIAEGLFDVKVGYTVVKNAQNLVGTLDIFRKMEAGKYVTKVVLNDKDIVVVGLTLDTDMKNKNLITVSYQGESYSLRINRVRGSSFILATTYAGNEYSSVVSVNPVTKKIIVRASVNKEEKHKAEIVYNPISSEFGIYVNGDVFGPVDARIIVQKDLSFAQLSISHNKKSYIYLNISGKMMMSSSMIPDFLRYEIVYDILEGMYGEGKCKVNMNTMDVEKVLSVSVAPKTGHAYDFTLSGKVDKDYSFVVSHELLQNKLVLYTASHKHTVAFNNAEKWMSLQKDKCTIPAKSPLRSLVQGWYIGDLLTDMQRKMAVNIDWRSQTGMIPKIDYKDTVTTSGQKHFNLALNTMKSPFDLHLRYPSGPVFMGINLGLSSLIGQDQVNCGITFIPGKTISVSSDIDNMSVSLKLPSSQSLQSSTTGQIVALSVSKTQKNEKIVEFDIIKEGSKAFKVNGFVNMNTPNMPYICTSGKGSCHWSSSLNLDIDLAQTVSRLIPINTCSFSLSKDYETVMEIQQSIKKSPYFIRVNSPMFLPKLLDITINHQSQEQMTVKFADYLPGEIKIDIVGSKHIISFEGYELATVDINLTKKMITFAVALLPQPIATFTFETTAFLANNVAFVLDLPLLGNVLIVDAKWLVKTINDFTTTTNIVATLPLVGKIDNTVTVVAEATVPKGKVQITVDAKFTDGLVAHIPPVSVAFATTYDIKALECTVHSMMNGGYLSMPISLSSGEGYSGLVHGCSNLCAANSILLSVSEYISCTEKCVQLNGPENYQPSY